MTRYPWSRSLAWLSVSLSLLTVHVSRLSAQLPTHAPAHFQKLAHTYSLVAWDSATGDLGVVVQSKFPNVGGIVPWARAGVGAVATQSLSNTAYGERGLELLASGSTAEEALRAVMKTDTMLPDRQVGIVDARGNAASFSGERTFDWSGGRVGAPGGKGNIAGGKGQVLVGHGFSAQANIMVSDQTVKNLAETFERTKGNLADRLVAALKAGQAGGGDKRGMQSAALLVVRKNGGYLGDNDRFIDIRVYDAPDPIAELERLLTLHKLHFFPSEPQDLIPITPDIVAKLEPILLSEPANQKEKWLTPEAGHRRPAVPRGAQELHVLGELRREGADGREDRQGRARRHPEERRGSAWPPPPFVQPRLLRSATPASSGIRRGCDALLHRDVGAFQLLRHAGAAHPLHDRRRSPRAASASTRPRPAPSTAPTSPWCT